MKVCIIFKTRALFCHWYMKIKKLERANEQSLKRFYVHNSVGSFYSKICCESLCDNLCTKFYTKCENIKFIHEIIWGRIVFKICLIECVGSFLKFFSAFSILYETFPIGSLQFVFELCHCSLGDSARW